MVAEMWISLASLAILQRMLADFQLSVRAATGRDWQTNDIKITDCRLSSSCLKHRLREFVSLSKTSQSPSAPVPIHLCCLVMPQDQHAHELHMLHFRWMLLGRVVMLRPNPGPKVNEASKAPHVL